MSGATGERPFASVIVPFWGSDVGQLRKCLMAIVSQDYPRDRFEVIVIDNHRDPQPMLAASLPPGCILLHEPKPGSYSARNRGLSKAQGDIVAFTDADCHPESGWLAAGVRSLEEDPGLGFIGGHIALTHRGRRPNLCEINDLCLGMKQALYVTQGGFAATANLFTRAAVIEQVGKFDEAFYSGGDRTWGERATRLGYRCAYKADAVVQHPARATLAALLYKARRLSAQTLMRHRAAGHTGLRLCLFIAKRECLASANRFVEIGKQWRTFGVFPTCGAVVVAGLVSLGRMSEHLRLALGGRPLR